MAELSRLIDLLQEFTFEELLEQCDLTPEEAMEHLYYGGYLSIPPFIEDMDTDTEEDGLE